MDISMKFSIISIAHKAPAWINHGVEEYLKRINRGVYNCELIEIKSNRNPNHSVSENMQLEAQKIEAQIKSGSYLVILDEKGESLSSIKFADKIDQIKQHNSHITLVIGGADGISDQLKSKANYIFSLSKLTYPHQLVKIVILEQIYRAISILENHPYHRE